MEEIKQKQSIFAHAPPEVILEEPSCETFSESSSNSNSSSSTESNSNVAAIPA